MRSILQDFLSIHPEGISHSIPFLQKSPSDTRSTFDIHSTTTQALSSIFDAGREQVIQKILVPNKAEYRRHMDINTQKVLPFGSKTQKNRACNQYYPSNIRIYSAEIEESSFPTQKQNFLKRIGATSKSERFTQSEEYAFTYRLLTTSILVRELQLYPWRYESAYPKEYLQDRMMLCFGKVYLASAVLKQLNIPYLVYAMDHHANLVVLFWETLYWMDFEAWVFQPAELKSIPGSLRFRSNLCEEEGTLLPGESGVFALLLQSRGADVYDVGRGSLRLSREYFERANELLQGKLASLTENLLLYSYSSTKKNESELLLSRLLSLLADTTTFQRGCSQLQLFVEGTFSESEIRSFLLREAPEIIHSQSASGWHLLKIYMNSLFSLPPVLHERAAKLLHFLGEHLGWNPPLRGTGYMAYLAEIRARRNKLRKAGEQELQAFLASTQSNR